MRRAVARNSYAWTTAAPVSSAAAGAGAGARRTLSHAVSLDPAQHSAQAQAWTASSRSLFASRGGGGGSSQARQEEDDGRQQLDRSVLSLIDELKRKQPDPATCWQLFHDVDQNGLAPTIPPFSLHALLAAIHTRTTARTRTLTTERATALARDYAVRIELIRMRLAQAGGATTPGDFKAILEQYRAFRYAPGALQTWDEMITAGDVPTPQKCRLVFETLAGWIEMHGREAGRAVERAAALPLAKQATRILLDDIGLDRSAHLDQCVEPYLEIVAKAGDFALLTKAVKALYGFDVRLPGALVDVKASQRSRLRTLGPRELDWILAGLGQANELSTMVAVFETFDSPSEEASTCSPSSSSTVATADTASFFSSTFSKLSVDSDSSSSDAQPVPTATRESQAHLIGTRALQTMVETAARLNRPALVRHYFDLLFCRWEAGVSDLLASWERATGVTAATAPANGTSVSARHPDRPRLIARCLSFSSAADSSSPSPPAPWIGSPFANSLTSIKYRHLARAPSAPEQPYRLPVSLAMLVSQYSYINYQAATSKWNRIRTKRIVQVLEQQATRLERILEKLEPTESTSTSQPVASTSTSASASASASGVVISLARVLREFRKVTTDLALLRETLATVKHNNRIVHSWDTRHLHQYELSLIRRKGVRLSRSTPRRGAGGAGGSSAGTTNGGGGTISMSSAAVKEERVRLDRLEAKRARKVDIWTARLAKSRLEKMVKVEGRGAGDRRFDAELKKLVELREKLVPNRHSDGAPAAPSSEPASA